MAAEGGVTLGEGILSAIFTLGVIARFVDSRFLNKSVMTSSSNDANAIRIAVDAATDDLKKKLATIDAKVESDIRATVESRSAMTAGIYEMRKSVAVLTHNVKNVCARSGVPWTDEVTVIPAEPQKKEKPK